MPHAILNGMMGTQGISPYIPPTTNLILDINMALDVFSNYSGTTPQTTDGGSVGHIGDQSSYTYAGNPLSTRQLDTAEKPLFYNSDPNRNDKPYILLDSSDRYLVMEPYSGAYDINGSTGATGMTAYLVIDPGTQDYDAGLITKNSDFFHDDGFAVWMNDTTNDDLNAYVIDEGFPSYNEINNNDPNGSACIVSYSIETSDTAANRVNALRVKNAGLSVQARDSGSTNDMDSNADFPSEKMLIGTLRNTSGNPSTLYTFDGKIFRVLLFDVCHSEATQEAIMNGLGTIYNI